MSRFRAIYLVSDLLKSKPSTTHRVINFFKVPPSHQVFQVRSYAKGKDKKREDKGKGHKKSVTVNETFLSETINVEKMKLEMENNVEKLNENFVKYLSIRTASGSIEGLIVIVDGKKIPLMEIGQIIRNNPKTITINMSSYPQIIPQVLKAISDSGMNLNPQQDGTKIYLPVPKVTKEHRENLAKNAKAHFIKCKDGIRDVQQKFIKSLKAKEKDGLSTDTSHQIGDQIKQIADGYIEGAEKILESKQQELLGS